MIQNFVRMTTWTDPLTNSRFVEDWSIFYWSWWVAVGPFNGMFITKLDVFFQAKDDTLPVWCEVRTVTNGYPSNVIMPFSKVSLTPSDVTVDATGATATTFTFASPIYIQNFQEFCVVLASNSPKYKVWISQL